MGSVDRKGREIKLAAPSVTIATIATVADR